MRDMDIIEKLLDEFGWSITCKEAADTIESLRQRIEELEKILTIAHLPHEEIIMKLASRDARIAELRGALEEIVNHLGHPDDESTKLFRKMLSTPDDLSSLNRVRAEELREVIFRLDNMTFSANSQEAIGNIRTCVGVIRRMADELEGKG